jgi:hypothetical protein
MNSTIEKLQAAIAIVGTNRESHSQLTKGVIVELRDQLHLIVGTPDGRFRLTDRGQHVYNKIVAGETMAEGDFRE